MSGQCTSYRPAVQITGKSASTLAVSWFSLHPCQRENVDSCYDAVVLANEKIEFTQRVVKMLVKD